MLKFKQQAGVVTLIVTLVFLITLTLIVAFATRVGIFDLRMAANESRYREAFSIAEGGLDFAIEKFAKNTTPLNGNYIYDPDRNGTADVIPSPLLTNFNSNGSVASNAQARFTATVTQQTVEGVTVFTFSSTGQSIDRSAKAIVSKQIIIRGITNGQTPNAPVMIDGAMDVTGNIHIVANPNAVKNCVQSCAVSVWTSGAVAVGSSISTCYLQGYTGTQCLNLALDPMLLQITNSADKGLDIIQNDPYTNANPAGNFPPDLFAYLFGVAYTEWPSIKALKTNTDVQTTCEHLTAGSQGLHWLDSCSIAANTKVGSIVNPVILVLHNNPFQAADGVVINGIVFVFDDTPDNAPTVNPSVLGGGSVINGSLLSNAAFNGGTFTVVYNPEVLSNLINNTGSAYRTVATVPGSWHDFGEVK
ncbi:MAG: hypothetical protein HFP77_06600 [Methylococcales symbiont of Iophon sp. n. MRB-2018]|nr:MAG: hypothetical protein HFP77_06600 [Methylococcales symbiont of Iophon sp. n. MRB-2018]KAF3979673.1 MAG: hypothetical protein HFP76_05970 [Methylococcales symbiont of Iophon sp. n. MRB-2018]